MTTAVAFNDVTPAIKLTRCLQRISLKLQAAALPHAAAIAKEFGGCVFVATSLRQRH
jgi:hypothetical protein